MNPQVLTSQRPRTMTSHNSQIIIDFLRARQSTPMINLGAPGPDKATLGTILEAAQYVSDHARLRPWRYAIIDNDDRRTQLGDILKTSLLKRDPDASAMMLDKETQKPFRAPLIIAIGAHIVDHPKVPKWEQIISTGLSAYSIEQAAQALGFGAVWVSGGVCKDMDVPAKLGFEKDTELLGFLYIGSVVSDVKKPAKNANWQELTHYL